MMSPRHLWLALLLSCMTLPLAGCEGCNSTYDDEVEFELGDLVEDFEPPSLAEVEKKVEGAGGWKAMPVLDAMELLRKRQATEDKLATVEEALSLRNDSPEDNAKILSALGRLPESEQAVDYEAVITRHSAADLKSSNPLLVSSTIEMEVSGLTGFSLFNFDWNFKPFASKDHVKSWHSSTDRLYDKIVMRDDLTWSDGKPITAHDVEFSYRVIMSKAVPVPAVRSGTDKLKYVKAYDDHTLVVFHREPLATNIWNMMFPVIPKHVYEASIEEDPTLQNSEYHVKYERTPVSGGPYRIASRTLNQEIILQRREDYYTHDGEQVRPQPHFKEIRIRVIQDPATALLTLKANDIDEVSLTPEQWRTQTNDDKFYEHNTKAYGLEWVSYHFGWNCKSPFFNDQRVRKAMSYAFDHEAMLERLRFGLDEPCNGIFHKTSIWSPKGDDAPKPYQRDISKAEALLEEAGWVDSDRDGIRDKDGRKFEFTIITSNRQDRIDICNLLSRNLKQIGILCTVRPLDFTTVQEKTRKHEFNAYFGGWGTGADPDTSENIWGTDADRNFVQYSNPKVDELFKKGRQEIDREKRAEHYRQIHKLLYEDQPYTWLFFRNSYYGFNKDIRGLNFSPRGPYGYGPGFNALWKPAS